MQKFSSFNFGYFLPFSKIALHQSNKIVIFSFLLSDGKIGLSTFYIQGVLHMISLFEANFGYFSIGAGVKSDEDDHGSLCTVSGVLTPQGEYSKKHFINLS